MPWKEACSVLARSSNAASDFCSSATLVRSDADSRRRTSSSSWIDCSSARSVTSADRTSSARHTAIWRSSIAMLLVPISLVIAVATSRMPELMCMAAATRERSTLDSCRDVASMPAGRPAWRSTLSWAGLRLACKSPRSDCSLRLPSQALPQTTGISSAGNSRRRRFSTAALINAASVPGLGAGRRD